MRADLERRALGYGDAERTLAVKAGAALWEAAFRGLEVTGAPMLTPQLLAHAGRMLALRREALFVLDVRAGRLHLLPAGWWNVYGRSLDPREWIYQVDLGSPSGTLTRRVAGAGVAHAVLTPARGEPWRAVPITRDAALWAAIEDALRQETRFKRAKLLGVDSGTAAPSREDLGEMLSDGGIVVLPGESTRAGLPNQVQAARIGVADIRPDPADGLVTTRVQARDELLAAMGVPRELITGATGPAAREAYRRFAALAIEPAARVLAQALSTALETGVTLSTAALMAADVPARARALKGLKDAGLSLAEAREVARI
ncbi:MAG: phage portal protein [Acidobacteria bacterium]|nr:phage portal protein [Acidobacteriota bacterium]